MDEGAEEVQSIGGEQRDGDVPEGFVVPNQPNKKLQRDRSSGLT